MSERDLHTVLPRPRTEAFRDKVDPCARRMKCKPRKDETRQDRIAEEEEKNRIRRRRSAAEGMTNRKCRVLEFTYSAAKSKLISSDWFSSIGVFGYFKSHLRTDPSDSVKLSADKSHPLMMMMEHSMLGILKEGTRNVFDISPFHERNGAMYTVLCYVCTLYSPSLKS